MSVQAAVDTSASLTLPSTLSRILNKHLSPLTSAAITTVVMLALVGIVCAFSVANPNMILISGLVIFSTLFGFTGGIPAATIMMGYTLYFFSTDHSWFTFSEENLYKVLVSAIGIGVVLFFVCLLKREQDWAFEETQRMAELLQEDNRLLGERSLTDSLTGIRNRMALRQDYDSYSGQELLVMMADIDNFKAINDTHGHDVGDEVLGQMGATLEQHFGREHAYRFGGDEFLVIMPVQGERELQRHVKGFDRDMHKLTIDMTGTPLEFSAGYVCGTPTHGDDLRAMIKRADEMLYEAKGAGKNLITGQPVYAGVKQGTPHTLV